MKLHELTIPQRTTSNVQEMAWIERGNDSEATGDIIAFRKAKEAADLQKKEFDETVESIFRDIERFWRWKVVCKLIFAFLKWCLIKTTASHAST